jgi:hypothetical protein
VPGRPLLYATSRRFLEVFGLESIKDLPALRELEELAREQGLILPGAGGTEGDQSSAFEDPMLKPAAEDPGAEVSESFEVTENSSEGLGVVPENDSPEDEESESVL